MSQDARQAAYERARQTFHAEAEEMVQQMEQCLLTLEEDPADRELLNALFRSVHTIKGSAGLFALEHLVRFTHQVEGVLDLLRAGKAQLDQPLSSLLLACADQIAKLLLAARETNGGDVDPDLAAESDALIARLAPYLPGGDGSKQLAVVAATADAGPGANLPVAGDGPGIWHISLRFAADSFMHGIDPLATVRYLKGLGELLLVETFDAALPSLSQLPVDQCYLGFEIRLRTSVSQAELEEAFEFIRDECRIQLIPPRPDVEHFVRLIEALPGDAERLGEILVECGAISRAQLHKALAQQHIEAAVNNNGRPLGSILVEQSAVKPQVVDAALKKQNATREKQAQARFFRVEAEKLDHLINYVGELVIYAAAARTQALEHGALRLIETTLQMGRLIEEIRNGALSLRMVAIGETFERYRRVVRDIAAGLGKDVRLDIEGGETELDKSVVERIGDPLMHLVRNALDHGLETPDERVRAGKPAQGCLRLSALHDSGSIVIEVRDDGRGIDPDKVLRRARERGLVPANAALAHEDILKLIFEPGFSTADKVSDLSGRGVGMDVVKRNIEALRGSVNIASQVGHGSVMTIRLPLTLAIIDGFLVRCGDSHFVVPLEHVEECIAAGNALEHSGDGTGVIDLRGAPLPVVRVADALGLATPPAARQSIVVVRCREQRAGLVVDQLLGEHQTVIKPLGPLYAHLEFIAGSTILGSGQVALILDVAGLLARVARARRAGKETAAVSAA